MKNNAKPMYLIQDEGVFVLPTGWLFDMDVDVENNGKANVPFLFFKLTLVECTQRGEIRIGSFQGVEWLSISHIENLKDSIPSDIDIKEEVIWISNGLASLL